MNIRKLALAGAAATALLSTTALAQSNHLFESVGPKTNAASVTTKTSQKIKLNKSALNAPSLQIDLFGEKVTAVRNRIDRVSGVTSWYGSVGGNGAEPVTLTMKGTGFTGRIDYGGNSYEITKNGKDGFVINEIDFSGFPEFEPAELFQPSESDAASTTGSAVTSAAAGENVQHDVLMVYTDKACVGAGGVAGVNCDQVESTIINSIARMNTALVTSGVALTMNIAGMMEVVYDETGKTAQQMLDELISPTDGIIDEVHAERNVVGADIVSIVTLSGGGFCGLAKKSPGESEAFNQNALGCFNVDVLPHEIGHNQGLWHDRETAQTTTVLPTFYFFGYRRCNETDGSFDATAAPHFRTIMAYDCPGAQRILQFSNPDINYLGVPTGIPVTGEPGNFPVNAAQRLRDRMDFVAAFREGSTTPTDPPAAPTNASASAIAPDTINVNWTDNATDETSFTLQRSLDDATWSTIATLGANVVSFADSNLQAETQYFYRVRANNGGGSSTYSNSATATTEGQPSTVDDLATGQLLTNGNVAGAYTNTHADDGSVQTITEASSGGPKRSRKQSYTHDWTFDVTGGGGGVVLSANAWVSGSEGANFSYSTDGGASYNLMFTVNETASSTMKTFTFPGGTSGAVRVRVQDATQVNGEGVDSLTVDYLAITSNTEIGEPPANPSDMVVTSTTSSTVGLSFTDNASDEFGFDIYRAEADPVTDCDAGASIGTAGANTGTGTVAYTDTNAAPSTTYWYWAKAFNGAGDNGQCSNAASGTTDTAPAMTASGNGYKVKGKQTVDVSWSGATTPNVDIKRDGATVATTANDGSYTDNIGVKGGGSYTYEVCEQGTAVCAATFNIVF